MLDHIQASPPQVLDAVINTDVPIAITNSLLLTKGRFIFCILALGTPLPLRFKHNGFHPDRFGKALVARPVPVRWIHLNEVAVLRHEQHVCQTRSVNGKKHIRFCQLHDTLVYCQLLQHDIVVRVLWVIAPPFSYIIEKHLIDALDQLVMVENQSEGGSPHNSQLQLLIPAVWRIEVHVGVGGCPKPVSSKESS